MTVAEAVDRVKWAKFLVNHQTFAPETEEALEMAIRSLEAWDKVRTEIETEANAIPYGREYYLDKKIEGLEMALEIIDKHLKGGDGKCCVTDIPESQSQ